MTRDVSTLPGALTTARSPVVAALLAGCTLLGGCSLLAPAPPTTVTATVTVAPTPSTTPIALPTPTQPEAPAPELAPLPPTPPNPAGGETDGGNTSTTPPVADNGPQPYADGPAEQLSDYEYRYTVTENDTALAIASRFQLQTIDVVRVNFRCSDPLNVQPGDVLDIRWPQSEEVVGAGC